MLETDDELSGLSDWDFEDIMNTTGVSPEEEFSSDINENLEDQPQPVLTLFTLLHQRNVPD